MTTINKANSVSSELEMNFLEGHDYDCIQSSDESYEGQCMEDI